MCTQPRFPVNSKLFQAEAPQPDLPAGILVSPVFDTYWKFATRRQEIFFRRLVSPNGYPWTDDPILMQNKFTNAYRASDRVSQYLIAKVIPEGSPCAKETCFRILLFKFFNRIETWELISASVGIPEWRTYAFDRYDAILNGAVETGTRIYSAAYIMPSGAKGDRKHRHHLHLLEQMMNSDLPDKLQRCRTMESAFHLLRSYPSIGDFLAYQLITDLNYSELLNFSEKEFVRPGPGARDGIKKCFPRTEGKSAEWLIRWVAETQDAQFSRLGLTFRNLWGRPLQLIDCQNLFCEVDKYARYVHPEIMGLSGRHRIKQRFRPNPSPLKYIFPEKWGIRGNVTAFGGTWGSEPSFSGVAAD